MQRDLYPLAPPTPSEITDIIEITGPAAAAARRFFAGLVAGLNDLYGVKAAALVLRTRTATQRAALDVILRATAATVARLDGAEGSRSPAAWGDLEDRGGISQLALSADLVDVPAAAGACSPYLLVPSPLRDQICDAKSLFAAAPPGLERSPGFFAGGRSEYVKLTVRQLQAGLPELRSSCVGGRHRLPCRRS